MKRQTLALTLILVITGFAFSAQAGDDKFLDFNLSLFSPQYGGCAPYYGDSCTGATQYGVANYSTTYQTQTYATSYQAPVAYTTYQTAPVYVTSQPAAVATMYRPAAYATTYQPAVYTTTYQPAAYATTFQPAVYSASAWYPTASQTTVSYPVTSYNYSYHSWSTPRPYYHQRRDHLLEVGTQLSLFPTCNPLFSLNVGLF